MAATIHALAGEATCTACGSGFASIGPLSRRKSFCSPLCAKAKALAMLTLHEAIVKVTDDEVICLVCKKHLQVAGTHFKRIHGIDTSAESTKTERQIAYGLPEGSRLVPPRVLRGMSERAFKSGFSKLGGFRASRKKSDHNRPRAARSVAQRLHVAKYRGTGKAVAPEWNKKQREETLVPWACATCGKSEMRNRGHGSDHRYCSLKCRPTHEKTLAVLAAARDRLQRTALAARTRPCAWCETVFTSVSKAGRGVRFCSPRCSMKSRYANREKTCTAPGCDRNRIARGLCTMHYQQHRKAKARA